MYGKNILLVDDEPRTIQGLYKTLDTWSDGRYTVFTSINAAEAMKIMEEKRIHLLITDISMPEMNGLQMLHQLREKGQKPVVIIVSAYSEFHYAQEAIELGVVNYLLKPVNKRKMIEAAEQALEIEAEREKVEKLAKVMDNKLAEAENPEGPVGRAMKYVMENVDRPLSLKEVAGHVHLNPAYFSVLFKEQAKMTFSEYLTRCRLQSAKKLLLNTNLSVEEIAEKIGYSTSKYFIKIFKEHEGVTPSKYKKF